MAHNPGQPGQEQDNNALLEALFGAGLFHPGAQEGEGAQGLSTALGQSPHISSLLDMLQQQSTPRPPSRTTPPPHSLSPGLPDMPSLLSDPIPRTASGGLESPFYSMVFTPPAPAGPASLESILNLSSPAAPSTSEAMRKVELLRAAINNLPPGAVLEDVLSPNSREFLRAQQQLLGTPLQGGATPARLALQQLFQSASSSPPQEVSPSAFMNFAQGGGGGLQATEAPPFQMGVPEQASPPLFGAQRRLSLDQFYGGATPERPSAANITARFISAQQERMDQRRQLREQARQREVQQFGTATSPPASYPTAASISAQQMAARLWQSGPLQEALNEFVEEPPQSMHSGMLSQDNPAGARARARGLAYPSGQSFSVKGGQGGQGAPRPGDAQSEMAGRSQTSGKRGAPGGRSGSGDEASAESAPQRKRARKPAAAVSNPLELRIPPAPLFTAGGPRAATESSVQYLRRGPGLEPSSRPSIVAPGLAPFVYQPPADVQQMAGYGGVHLPARSLETQERRDDVTPETHIKTTRARRGQATDPHSIAERLRRERIAEKMRQLQALIPHQKSNDKATMLSGIIEYIKFMQMQVHVLGLGKGVAAPVSTALPAGLPEVAKGPTEGPLPMQDATVAQELVTHLETGPEWAVQYLLERGLCLMPAPLAAQVLQAGPGPDQPPAAPPGQATSGTVVQDQSASVASSVPSNVNVPSASQPARDAPPAATVLSGWAGEGGSNRPQGAPVGSLGGRAAPSGVQVSRGSMAQQGGTGSGG